MQLTMRVLAVMTSLVVCMANPMSEEIKEYIMKLHNKYRTGEHAANMIRLEWNTTLAEEADAWSRNCQFKHKGMGENLAWNSMIATPEKELIDNAMKNFFDEKLRYTYGQNSCGSTMACHYTQLVWAKTSQVGCATQVCQPLVGAYSKAWFLVCRYNPVGNWNGEKPYDKGAPCSECPGAPCVDGLCVGADSVKTPCEDKNAQCAAWADRGECTSNPGFMDRDCKKSCNKC